MVNLLSLRAGKFTNFAIWRASNSSSKVLNKLLTLSERNRAKKKKMVLCKTVERIQQTYSQTLLLNSMTADWLLITFVLKNH